MLCLCLALGLLDCSGWLLGQGGEVPADSTSGTDFLLSDCSGDSAADTEHTVSETAIKHIAIYDGDRSTNQKHCIQKAIIMICI
jgi:hypothetical protein